MVLVQQAGVFEYPVTKCKLTRKSKGTSKRTGREDKTVKEAQAPSPPSPFGSKRYINTPKPRQMAQKW
jgi:hypothetical protein